MAQSNDDKSAIKSISFYTWYSRTGNDGSNKKSAQ